MYLKAILMILGLFYRNCLNFSDNTGAVCEKFISME